MGGSRPMVGGFGAKVSAGLTSDCGSFVRPGWVLRWWSLPCDLFLMLVFVAENAVWGSLNFHV